jgi:hypothetical protein
VQESKGNPDTCQELRKREADAGKNFKRELGIDNSVYLAPTVGGKGHIWSSWRDHPYLLIYTSDHAFSVSTPHPLLIPILLPPTPIFFETHPLLKLTSPVSFGYLLANTFFVQNSSSLNPKAAHMRFANA